MNDYYRGYADFPTNDRQSSAVPEPPIYSRDARWDQQYERWRGWARYEAVLAIADSVERYVFRDRLPITLFTVNVKNRNQGSKDRPVAGDTYIVIFSNVPSHVLFEEAILPMRLNVSTVLLSKVGGFAGELDNYNQYYEIPRLLREFEPELGLVDLYLIDANGQDQESGRPRVECLADYSYVGGPIKLGWYPCRAYGRPGLAYNLERKALRLT
jgi:hypothetical protein